MRILFLILAGLLFLAAPLQRVFAQQQYPVQIQPAVSFPSTFINDYADPENTNIRVYLADLTKVNYKINIRVKLESSGKNVIYQSKTGITITLDGGDVYFLNDQDLAKLFSITDLPTNATSQTDFVNVLPEGVYTMSLEAFDASVLPVEIPVSNSRTDFTIFNVVRYDPPMLNAPNNGEAFDIQTINQNIFFTWTPRHVVYTPKQQVKYRFTLIKVVPVDRNPYDAIKASVPKAAGNIEVEDLDFPTFVYSPADLPLEEGCVYAWQVQAYEVVNGIQKATSRFKNEGYSEVYTFSIKENCEPVTINPISVSGNQVTLSWFGSTISTYTEYEVNYRQAMSSQPWIPVITSQKSLTLDNTILRSDLTYEYTVKARCKNWQTPVYGGTFKLEPATCVAPKPVTVDTKSGSPVLTWIDNPGVDSIRLYYKEKSSPGTFTRVLIPGGTQTFTLPPLNHDGYIVELDAVCDTETGAGVKDTFNYDENGQIGPCPIPVPFQFSALRVVGDTATLGWEQAAGNTAYSITYWHKDSAAVTHTINNLLSPTTKANLLFDNQLYAYKVTFMCGTKSTTTPVGMFRIDGSINTVPLDPKTADCFPPVDLQGQARSTTSAFVEWNKIDGADEYQLFYGVKGTKPFKPFTTTATSTTLKNLDDSQQYQFIVRVRCGGLYSIFSDTALVDLAQTIANKNCDTVVFLAAIKKTTTNVLLAWKYNANYSGYIITYRESAQPPSTVYTQAFTNIDTLVQNHLYNDSVKYTFQNLKAGTEYLFTIQAVCGAGKAFINAPLKVSTLPDAKSTGTCGSTNACDKTDKTPLVTLNVGEKFHCADYEVTVDEIDNPNSPTGSYTGNGHMNMPVAGVGDFVTMSISFENIKINADTNRCVIDGIINVDSINAGLLPTELRQQIGGYMDQVTNAISQANDLLTQASDGLNQAQDAVQQATDYFQGGENTGGVVSGDLGETKVTGTVPTSTTSATVSGTSVTLPPCAAVTVAAFPALLKDDAGNVFQVSSTGAVVHVGTYDNTYAADPITVDPDTKQVVFEENVTAKYDFDMWKAEYKGVLQIEREYEKIGSGYYVPAKCITPGEMDVVNAKLSGTGTDPSKVIFANGKGLVYKHTKSGSTFTVNLAGGPGADAQEIYAWYVDGTAKTAIGKLLVPSYGRQTKNVVIIPIDLVNGVKQSINAALYETFLNKTYGRIGITYKVTVDETFRGNKSWDADGNNSVQVKGSSILNNDYQGEERAMIEAYAASKGATGLDANTAYFLAPYEVSQIESKLLGKMPAEEQFGFLYTASTTPDGIARTIAHELGHGAYHLEHIFISAYLGPGTNDAIKNGSLNLMSYFNDPKANELWKFQWDAVQAPGHVWGILKKDGDSEARDLVKSLCKIIDAIGQGSSAEDRKNAVVDAEDYASKNSIQLPSFRNLASSESEFFNTQNATTSNLKFFMYKLFCQGIKFNIGYIKTLEMNTNAYKKDPADEGYTINCESADYTIWFRNSNIYPFILGGFQVVDKNGKVDYELSGIGQAAINTYPNDRIKGVLCAIYTIFNNVALSKGVTIEFPSAYKNCSTGKFEYYPVLTFDVNPNQITEDEGISTVTAKLSFASDTDVKVFFSYANTAQIGIDYTADNYVIIPLGSTEATFNIKAIKDAIAESDEFIDIDIQKIEGHAINSVGGPQTVTIKESPHATLATLDQVHTYVGQNGTITIFWTSTGGVNQLKWKKNSAATEKAAIVNCVNGQCSATITGVTKSDLINYTISTNNVGDAGTTSISSTTNGFQGENCIECLCDGELLTIGNKSFNASDYQIEWRNSSVGAIPEFDGKTTLPSFEFKLSGIKTYIIKRTHADGIYDEAEVYIKPVLNCTWFLQAKDINPPPGSGPRVAKNGQTLQLVEPNKNSSGNDAIVEMIEGSTKNAYFKGDPKWEKDGTLISNTTSVKKRDDVAHNSFGPGNEIINPGSGNPDEDAYVVSALNKSESVNVEYFYENKDKVADPLAIPELALYQNVSDICIVVRDTKIKIDRILDQAVNNPINQNAIDPMNNVIRSANSTINTANATAGTSIPQIPLIPHVDFQFPFGCDISNNIYMLNAEKQSSPDVVRDTYGDYNINFTGEGTIPIGIGDLIVTTNPIVLTYDRNLRKTPATASNVTLVSNDQSMTFSRAFPDASPVQLQLNVSVIFDIKSPCTTNPAPCLIEMDVSATVQFTPVSNSPYIPNGLLPTFPASPPISLGSYVLTNR